MLFNSHLLEEGDLASDVYFLSFLCFLVGELGVSAVSEYGRKIEVSQVTHPSINILVMCGLVQDGKVRMGEWLKSMNG